MPLAKAVVERSPLPDGLIECDQLSIVVIDMLRQLDRLVVACDVLVAELMSDAENVGQRVASLAARTVKLTERVYALDALTAKVRMYTVDFFRI